MENLIKSIKKLTKLVAQLDELMVKIISLVGWVLILFEILD